MWLTWNTTHTRWAGSVQLNHTRSWSWPAHLPILRENGKLSKDTSLPKMPNDETWDVCSWSVGPFTQQTHSFVAFAAVIDILSPPIITQDEDDMTQTWVQLHTTSDWSWQWQQPPPHCYSLWFSFSLTLFLWTISFTLPHSEFPGWEVLCTNCNEM